MTMLDIIQLSTYTHVQQVSANGCVIISIEYKKVKYMSEVYIYGFVMSLTSPYSIFPQKLAMMTLHN